MAMHKGLNIQVGGKMFRNVDKMGRRELWEVQDALEAERDSLRSKLFGNINANTQSLLQQQLNGIQKRSLRVDYLIRSLPVSLLPLKPEGTV